MMENQRHYPVLALALAAILWSPSSGGSAKEAGTEGDIVVEGTRNRGVFAAGEWLVRVSRSYHFGKSLDGREIVPAAGQDREWRFCLPATQVEALVALLAGQGRAQSSITTDCRKLALQLGDGRLRATQTCMGGNVTGPDPSGLIHTQRTRLILTVTGTYDAERFRLDFNDRREMLVPDPSAAQKSDLTRWSITGRQVGACPSPKEKSDLP